MYLVYFESGLSVECGDRSPHSTERHVFENEPDDLVEALPDLLSAEGADAVEPEAEHQAVFLSDADIEGVVLRRHRAAIPGIPQGNRRTDEGTAVRARSLLKVEEERRTAEESAFAIADK